MRCYRHGGALSTYPLLEKTGPCGASALNRGTRHAHESPGGRMIGQLAIDNCRTEGDGELRGSLHAMHPPICRTYPLIAQCSDRSAGLTRLHAPLKSSRRSYLPWARSDLNIGETRLDPISGAGRKEKRPNLRGVRIRGWVYFTRTYFRAKPLAVFETHGD
jgi:hypothetical protein